jgi:hypothetical protein
MPEEVRLESFAIGSSQQQVQSCLLCPAPEERALRKGQFYQRVAILAGSGIALAVAQALLLIKAG